MRYRWSYSEDGGTVWTEVSPTNGSRLSITQARDLSAGQVFFRKKLAQAVILGSTDYRAIDAIRRNPARRCETLLLRCEAMCGSWSEYWRGEFSAGSAKWDLDNCTVEIKAETVDRYTCLLEKKDVKRNILQVGVVDASAAAAPSIEWAACVFKLVNIIGPVYETQCSDGLVHTNPAAPPTNWWNAFGYPINPPNETLQIYWREYLYTECVGGVPSPPPGAGWTLFDDNCAVNGMAKYIREPLIAFAFDVQAGTCVDGVAVPPAVTCARPWTELTPCGFVVDGTTYPPYYVCYDPTQTALPRARTLQAATEYLIEQTGCELAGVRSDFLDWNAPGDTPGYVAGQNYVTGELNQMDALVILQKTDVIDPAATNPATIGEMTFTEMMTFLRVAPRLYWDIDDAGYVRIEHWSWWVFVVGLDLVTAERPNEPLVYESLGEEIPRVERARWMESQSRDFVGKDIIYDSPCVPDGAAENVKEWSPGRITTDVSFILNDPDAIGKDGFVILATELVGGVYQTIIDTGVITGNDVSNAPLSWANLQDAFWRHDRYLPSANMNGVDTVFEAYLPNVKQEQVSIRMCCDALAFDPEKRVVGELSRLLGTSGYVESASLDLYNQRLTLVLRYAY